ncbi:MAG: cadherin-like domain-containing protein, partial [Alphaproteobacteria bacterium]
MSGNDKGTVHDSSQGEDDINFDLTNQTDQTQRIGGAEQRSVSAEGASTTSGDVQFNSSLHQGSFSTELEVERNIIQEGAAIDDPAGDHPQVVTDGSASMSAGDTGDAASDGSFIVTSDQLLGHVPEADQGGLSVVNLKVADGQATVTANADGSWTVTPEPGWNGSLNLSYDVSDGTQITPTEAAVEVTAAPETDAATPAALAEQAATTLDPVPSQTEQMDSTLVESSPDGTSTNEPTTAGHESVTGNQTQQAEAPAGDQAPAQQAEAPADEPAPEQQAEAPADEPAPE